MALVIHFDGLIQFEAVSNNAELVRFVLIVCREMDSVLYAFAVVCWY